jgi:hypothetical protein
MARPKKNAAESDKAVSIGSKDSFVDSLIKEFGPVVFNAESNAENLKKMVIPYSPANDLMFGGGVKEGSSIIVNGLEKSGKMQDENSLIYTPFGPKRLGDISIGDVVCNADGGISKVLEIYKHGLQDVYEIEFCDGDKVRCGLEHLWEVKDTVNNKILVLSLERILALSYVTPNKLSSFKIKLPKPLNYLPRIVKIHPYLMGAILGDGGISQNSVRFTTGDKEILDRCNNCIKEDGFKLVLNDKNAKIDYRLASSKQKNIYIEYLKEYNLMGTNSHTKFIPEDYIYNSLENRIDLIRGLMDTDGEINKKGTHATYSTVSIKLAEGFKQLIESIGGSCIIKVKKGTYKGKPHYSWLCTIKYNNLPELFSLSRKKNRAKKGKYFLSRTIKSVRFFTKLPCLCIKLDSDDGLYLTNHCVVTHNTVSTLDFSATAQDIQYADEELFPDGRRVFFFSVENRLQERDIDGIHHLNKSKFDWIQSSPGNILPADKILAMAERALQQIPGCIVVIDSYSALCSTEEMTAGYDEQIRPKVPMMLAKFCKRVANVLPVNRNILIGITHRMANQGGGPAKWAEGGGTKIQYAADFKMKTHWSEDWMVDETKIGKIIHWECGTTALDRPVTTKAVSRFRFGYGIDKQGELIDLGQSLGLVERAGAWYSLPGTDIKAQGFEKMREVLIQKPEIYEELNKQFRTMMGFDRYNVEV